MKRWFLRLIGRSPEPYIRSYLRVLSNGTDHWLVLNGQLYQPVLVGDPHADAQLEVRRLEVWMHKQLGDA